VHVNLPSYIGNPASISTNHCEPPACIRDLASVIENTVYYIVANRMNITCGKLIITGYCFIGPMQKYMGYRPVRVATCKQSEAQYGLWADAAQ